MTAGTFCMPRHVTHLQEIWYEYFAVNVGLLFVNYSTRTLNEVQEEIYVH
jgi:hypothetical protein